MDAGAGRGGGIPDRPASRYSAPPAGGSIRRTCRGRLDRQGRWRLAQRGARALGGLADLLAFVDGCSPVSMFKVRWKLPTVEKRITAPKHIAGREAREFWEGIHSTFLPFFPLPYRTKSGAILFPSSGRSIAMRDDLVSAIKWLMKFVPEFPRKKTLGGSEIVFEIEGAWIWEIEGDPVHPFAFVPDMYNHRRAMKDEANERRFITLWK